MLLGFAGYVAYSQSEFGRVSDEIDAAILSYRQQRWERPTLRELPHEGNAATVIWAALRDFDGLRTHERTSLARSLHFGEPLSPVHLSLVEQESEMLARLRESGQRSWSMASLPVEEGLSMNAPAYPRVVDAALLWLASGAAGGTESCLQTAADVVRLGQDLVPGAPLEAASVSARLTTLATHMAGRCAGQADYAALSRAAREFTVLAKRPPPVGQVMEVRDLLILVDLRARANLFSRRFSEPMWARLWDRPEIFETIERIGAPSHWREITSTDHPRALEAWRSEEQWRVRSPIPLVAQRSAGVRGFVYDDMRGQAVVRATAVAFATLAERLRRGKIPPEPIGIADHGLRDPFTGRPLRWRVAEDGSEITLWSVGEDLRDDEGVDVWGSEAPRDIAVHMGFRSLSEVDGRDRRPSRGRGRKRG